jgi:hypothetical protein
VAIIHQTPTSIPGKVLHFPGPQVTWAGEFPWTHGLCFGTEDGSIDVRDINGVDIWSKPMLESGGAINGVAFSHSLAAISTRAELLLAKRSSSSDELQPMLLDQIGAHGIVAAGRGGFIAATGASGILQIELRSDGTPQGASQIRVSGRELYFYRIICLGTTAEGHEVFACAGRNDGVIGLEIGTDGCPKRVFITQNHNAPNREAPDIVDVCRLPSDKHPFAAASLGIDNSIRLSEDIRRGHRRLGLHFPEMQGTAYTVMSAQGHVFVLTSEAFYVLPKLAVRFLEGEQVEAKMIVLTIPLEALDCSIAYGEHLMLITANSVLLMGVSELATSPRVKASEMVPDLYQFAWESPTESPISLVPTSSSAATVPVG